MTEPELNTRLQTITPPDEAARAAAHAHWAALAKPLGGLGSLETMLEDAAALTGTPELDFARRAVLVLCADNGVVAQGVSQTDASVTRAVLQNLAARRTSVCQMAAAAHCSVVPVDMGIAGAPVPGVQDCRIAPGTKDFTCGPAMTRAQAVQAIGCGIALGDLTDSTLAAQLQEYLPQSAEGTTKTIDADGNVTFRGLELGLYLIVQTEASKGYEPINPFLVSLPMAEDGKWNYAVDASPKVGAYTPTKPDTPPTPPTPPTPDHPDTPTPPDNPDNPVSPGNPDNPVAPGHPDNPVAPGHPDHPVAPGNPDSPVLPGHPDNPVMTGLPQTGQLNWPVPVLAVSGVVLFAFGWALDRKYRAV